MVFLPKDLPRVFAKKLSPVLTPLKKVVDTFSKVVDTSVSLFQKRLNRLLNKKVPGFPLLKKVAKDPKGR